MMCTLAMKPWNTLSPLSLEELCLDFISKNIEDLTYELQECIENYNILAFKVPVFLHEQLAEAILRQLASSGRLTLKTLSLFLDRTTCRIKRACVQDSSIQEIGLRLLFTNHSITELDLRQTALIFSHRLSFLEGYEYTCYLKKLNISNAKNAVEGTAICSFKNLTFLDISKNMLNDSGLKIICKSLTQLEDLNVSCNPISDAESFGKAKERLKSLKAYNCPVAWNNPIDFAQFINLRHLDISRMLTHHMLPGDDVEKLEMLLSQKDALSCLEVFDISGTQRVMDRPLQTFLNAHPKLNFLGLCKTGVTLHADYLPKDIEVTGEATEQQILSSLQHYPDRASYMTESLSSLFHISKNWTEQRFEVLQYVLPPMEMHPKDLRMQMASTACIFNLTRTAKHQSDLHPIILGKIAGLVLKAVSSFTNKHELIRNCLLILGSSLMLRYATFDYYNACMSAMDALCLFINDLNIVRLATKICAVLTAKISNSETIALGTERHLKTLLEIVKDKVESKRSDHVLMLTLSVLWNLTDDAHCTCQLFVNSQGLILFIQVLKVFGTESIIVKKVLGTLNNIAEVEFLRPYILTDECISLLSDLLDRSEIPVCYFAGGILANVALAWEPHISVTPSKTMVIRKMEKAVLSWKTPAENMVAYRSFTPFVPLLKSNITTVRLWALWGILHVCTNNPSRYVPLLVRDGVKDVVTKISQDDNENVNLKMYSQKVCEQARKFLNEDTMKEDISMQYDE